MVFYDPPKRRMRKRNVEDKALITDLPDEILLEINKLLDIDVVLKLRLTCTALAPAALTSVQGRMKILYIHPSIPSLRTVPEICSHPFSQGVEQVILLGSVPWDDLHTVCEKDQKGKTLERQFASWPLEFPKPKALARVSCGEDQPPRPTIFVLVESIRKLPNFRHLTFQIMAGLPGLNQTSQTAMDAFAKKYIGKKNKDQRAFDMSFLLQLLTESTLNTKAFSIRTMLPFASLSLPGKSFSRLTSLELGLQLYTDSQDPCWWQHRKWQQTCEGLLIATPNLESLKLVLMGWAGFKRVSNMLSSALDGVHLTERTWPHLRSLVVKLLPDGSHGSPPRRPSLQTLADGAVVDFFERHAATLRGVLIENLLFAANGAVASKPSVIETMKRILGCLEGEGEYVVNKFTHHQYCKRVGEVDFENCRCDCGVYTTPEVDGGTTIRDFEGLVASVGVGEVEGVSVEEGEGGWTFSRTPPEKGSEE